jgi:hypothetical protein
VNEVATLSAAGGGSRLTSAVQGLSSKAASRVLINLFSASDCIPSPHRNFVVFGEGNKETDINKKCAESGAAISPDNNKATAQSPLQSKRNPVSNNNKKKQTPNIENKFKTNKPSKTSPLPPKASNKSKRCKPVSILKSIEKVVHIVPSKPWKFVYYHKSGFVKDTHVVWLQFLNEESGVGQQQHHHHQQQQQQQELRGRGQDDTGLFFLRGHVNIDIEGFSWQIEKCYVKKPMQSEATTSLLHSNPEVKSTGVITAEPTEPTEEDSGHDISRDTWCRNESGEWLEKDEIASWGRPHISHTGYSTVPVTDAVVTEAFVANQRVMALGNLRNNPILSNPSLMAELRDGGTVANQNFREDLSFYQSEDPVDNSSHIIHTNNRSNVTGKEKQHQIKSDYSAYVRFNTNWGGGLFGVWEVSTTESHFELVKGGVFRATPL